jgi:hypothetical protein
MAPNPHCAQVSRAMVCLKLPLTTAGTIDKSQVTFPSAWRAGSAQRPARMEAAHTPHPWQLHTAALEASQGSRCCRLCVATAAAEDKAPCGVPLL